MLTSSYLLPFNHGQMRSIFPRRIRIMSASF